MFEQAFKNIDDIQEKNRFEIILANPPFGGKERKEVQQNFPSKPARQRFCFSSTSSRSSKPVDVRPSLSRTRFYPTPTMHR